MLLCVALNYLFPVSDSQTFEISIHLTLGLLRGLLLWGFHSFVVVIISFSRLFIMRPNHCIFCPLSNLVIGAPLYHRLLCQISFIHLTVTPSMVDLQIVIHILFLNISNLLFSLVIMYVLKPLVRFNFFVVKYNRTFNFSMYHYFGP